MPLTPPPTGVASVNTAPSTIQTHLMRHYETISYSIILTAYVFSFGEYLFLRLTYLLNPGNVIHHATCQKRSSDVAGKSALNYAAVIVAFIAVAIFQITCFFGLTIAEKWVRYRVGQTSDATAKLRKLLSQRIQNIMESTVYPTFICYGLASTSVWLIIFYMFGIRDSIDELASTISLYIFDGVLVLYFFAFPVITYVYHPYVRRSAALAMVYATGVHNFRSGNRFGRQILPSNSTESQSSNRETPQSQKIAPCFVQPNFSHSFNSSREKERTTFSFQNPSSYQPNQEDVPATFRRNGRLTSTV